MASEQEKAGAETPMDICPYWHQVSADFASVYPGGGYCTAGCHQRIKVMAAKTFDEVCLLRYGGCEGYQRVLAAEEAQGPPHPEQTRR
jgi:hypothetical protein